MEPLQALAILEMLRVYLLGLLLDSMLLLSLTKIKRRRIDKNVAHYSHTLRIPAQLDHMARLTEGTESDCVHNLRMSRNAFGRLCTILKQLGGLTDTRGITVEEQICLFLSVISHHKKNRTVFFDFVRSGRTVSIHFHSVLQAILKLHSIFTVKPEPVQANSTDSTWKWFKGCLGALDGTLIDVIICDEDKVKYRSRKGKIQVNVLGVCDRKCNFVYVLTGWEGSAADGRVLRDALERPNGFKVPRGHYYLCDAGYTNGEGFLSPYRGTRYHLQEWGSRIPQNQKELFNLRHLTARNAVERAFGILKKRWAILRSASFYRIRTQNEIIIACCLLHNFIRGEMVIDPVELELTEEDLEPDLSDPIIGYIPHIETSPAWTQFRDALALTMWNNYRRRHWVHDMISTF